jgi:predicted regulator of Ras-like GTPase activity (Roadblock/LC7/MglB family)
MPNVPTNTGNQPVSSRYAAALNSNPGTGYQPAVEPLVRPVAEPLVRRMDDAIVRLKQSPDNSTGNSRAMPAIGTSTNRATSTAGASRRNYTSLVSALQTLGYGLPGFVAAAVASVDGIPLAQVAVDDRDLTDFCRQLTNVIAETRQALVVNGWEFHEQTLITSADGYALIRPVGYKREAFLLVLTTREAIPTSSQPMLVTVEIAIASAL